MREALEAHLSATESAYDALMQIGGIGLVKSGSGDLSSNKAHMEGFGLNVSSRITRHRSARRSS